MNNIKGLNICRWIKGFRVSISEWINKDPAGNPLLRFGVECFEPGGRLSCPTWEKVTFFSSKDIEYIMRHIENITLNIACDNIPNTRR